MPLTKGEAEHLCRRVGFGGKGSEITLFRSMERAEAVDYCLDALPDAPSAIPGINNHDWWEVISEFREWWLQRMVDARWHNRSSNTPSPLEEKMTLFWHSHFASGIEKVGHLRTMWKQHEILRNRSMGSFHTLLDRVCTNGAILTYLDNQQNTVWDLQENFARELMELYTIGPDEFVESDVVEMAKAWTGHGVVGWVGHQDSTYEYHGNAHDRSTKTLFNQAPQRWNGPDTLPIFTSGVKQDATVHFICSKLWRFFVNDEASEAELATIEAAFGSGLIIRDALRAILLHDSFWASENRFALTRSPVEFCVDMLRRLNVRAEDTGLRWMMGQLGQQLFEPPSVAGWGTGGYWVSTQGTWSRAGFLGSLRWDDRVRDQFDGLPDAASAEDAANLIISKMKIPSASTETRHQLETWWTTHTQRDQWAMSNNAVIVGGMMPELHVA
jgi:uncharacterized protein (DUF1800 family)